MIFAVWGHAPGGFACGFDKVHRRILPVLD